VLAEVYGQQQTQRGSLQHLCVGTGQTGVSPVIPLHTGQTGEGHRSVRPLPGVNRRKTSERRPGGAAHVGLHRSDRCTRRAVKSYLCHPDSDLDVPHMNLDLLDETYPMVQSK
jgi:hypothetical protein